MTGPGASPGADESELTPGAVGLLTDVQSARIAVHRVRQNSISLDRPRAVTKASTTSQVGGGLLPLAAFDKVDEAKKQRSDIC
jgi:hypothetical protein